MQLIPGNKRISLILLFAMLVLGAMGQVQEMYLKGIALSNQGKYGEARSQLEKAISIDSDNGDFLLKLAEINYQAGDIQSALGYLLDLAKTDPGKGSYLQARIYASTGQTAEAVKYLEMHLSSSYKLPSRIILLQEEFALIEKSREWKNLWSREWYTEDEQLLQEIRYLNTSGDQLQALEIIDARMENQNNWDALYASRGDVLIAMKQYQGSLQSYDRAIELSSANSSYYKGRAKAYLALDKMEKAVADLEKASRMEPEDLDLLMEIGKIYHLSGDFNKALFYMNRYKEYYPAKAESLYLLGEVSYDAKNYLDALAEFNACLSLSTSDPRFYAARGKTYLKTKTYRYALNDFGMALDLDPGDPEVWYMKGLVRWEMNDREGSISDWKNASRLGSYDAAMKLRELGHLQ